MTERARPEDVRDAAELAAALSDDWDALVRGEPRYPRAPADLATALRRLHARDGTPSLSAARRAGIWTDVLAAHAATPPTIGLLPAAPLASLRPPPAFR